MPDPPPSNASLASALWEKAWGKPWPHRSSGKVSMTDLCPDDIDDVPKLLQTDENHDSASRTAGEWEYTCLRDIHSVIKACGGPVPTFQDILVIRPEYLWLRESMETGYLREDKAIVVTGHPGIGQTVFLLYLLLDRLERRLPTAIHLFGSSFAMFNDKGATVRRVQDMVEMTRDYWALSDSNDQILRPCDAFQRSNARIIQASSPRPDRWKDWTKDHSASILVSDLPSPLEIGAIVKELQLDTVETYRFISKWGPCIRTTLDFLSRSPPLRAHFEEKLKNAAEAAAKAICATPAAFDSPLMQTAPGIGFSVLFISPHRPRDPHTSLVISSVSIYQIPTPYLSEMFNNERRLLSYEQTERLIDSLSASHWKRPAWPLDSHMHTHLCSNNSQPLAIFREHDSSTMQPSQQLLIGPVSDLAWCKAYPNFYWLSPAADLPGVDGVLKDGADIYVVQATTVKKYRSPADGLHTIWATFDRQVRDHCAWHLVFVSDSEELARRHAAKCEGEMKDSTLGRAIIQAKVWGCVLPSQ